jgi:hypothetical protein
VWIIAIGLLLTALITVYTHKYFMRCLSDFCNNHIQLVTCIAEHISRACFTMRDQEKTLSDHAMVVLQSFEALSSIADELDAAQKPEEADKQESKDGDAEDQ